MKPGISPVASRAAVVAALLLMMIGGSPALAQQPVAKPPAKTPAPSTGKLLDRSKGSLSATPSKSNLRPNGPVTISAKTAELVQGNYAVYTGDVVLNSNTLKLDGDKVEIKQYPGGDYEAKITGGPAHANHAGEGPDNPPLAARAKALNYDSRTGVLDMVGDAFAQRGSDQVTGETIRYIVKEHRIQAAGGEGRVTVIIQPRDDSTAPASGGPAAPDPSPATPADAEKEKKP